jgi:hypothetical protein
MSSNGGKSGSPGLPPWSRSSRLTRALMPITTPFFAGTAGSFARRRRQPFLKHSHSLLQVGVLADLHAKFQAGFCGSQTCRWGRSSAYQCDQRLDEFKTCSGQSTCRPLHDVGAKGLEFATELWVGQAAVNGAEAHASLVGGVLLGRSASERRYQQIVPATFLRSRHGTSPNGHSQEF